MYFLQAAHYDKATLFLPARAVSRGTQDGIDLIDTLFLPYRALVPSGDVNAGEVTVPFFGEYPKGVNDVRPIWAINKSLTIDTQHVKRYGCPYCKLCFKSKGNCQTHLTGRATKSRRGVTRCDEWQKILDEYAARNSVPSHQNGPLDLSDPKNYEVIIPPDD